MKPNLGQTLTTGFSAFFCWHEEECRKNKEKLANLGEKFSSLQQRNKLFLYTNYVGTEWKQTSKGRESNEKIKI